MPFSLQCPQSTWMRPFLPQRISFSSSPHQKKPNNQRCFFVRVDFLTNQNISTCYVTKNGKRITPPFVCRHPKSHFFAMLVIFQVILLS